MYYNNDFIDTLEEKVEMDKVTYANVQAHNIAKMLKQNGKHWYKLFGVYWWHVKDALRKYLDNNEWYCGIQDDPLMKERSWHGSEFRTILAAMYYLNEQTDFNNPKELTSAHLWTDKNGQTHNYTLFDPDANC